MLRDQDDFSVKATRMLTIVERHRTVVVLRGTPGVALGINEHGLRVRWRKVFAGTDRDMHLESDVTCYLPPKDADGVEWDGND